MGKLQQKLLQLQSAVIGLTKDKNGNSYQYVSGDKVLSIVRPKMDELGLILVPEVEGATYTREDYNLYDKNGNAKPKSEIFCNLKLKFTWIDTESDEKLECHWASTGQTGFDKSLGSALTYGERYFLLKFFHVATDKDDVDAPRTAEQEMSLQNAIAYINGLQTAADMQSAWNYYQQWFGKDKEFIKAYNKKMKEINDGTVSR